MRLLLRWVVWFVVLWWLWMLLAGEWNHDEWIAATAAAAAGATLLEVACRRAEVEPGVPLRLVAQSANVPLMVVADFGIVVWALVAGCVRGELPRGSFRSFESDVAEGEAIRTWATVAATFSPNAYVVDLDRQTGLALVHDLVPLRASEKPV